MFRTILLLMLSTSIIAQDDQYTAEYHKDFGLIITHEISAGQTIYGLTKHFGGDVDHTIALNDALDFTEVSIGDQLRFVLHTQLIEPQWSEEYGTPVYNVVQKGKTLYSIAKIYARQDVQTLMSINQLSNSNLKPGQKLLLGYISQPYTSTYFPTVTVEENPQSTQQPLIPTTKKRQELAVISQIKEIDPLLIQTHHQDMSHLVRTDYVDSDNRLIGVELDTASIATTEPHQFTHEKGLAYWQTINSNSKDLIVLHKNAPVNESITLFNPMMGREVKATVVAPIPEKSYPDNISIVISPAVAEALGALDKRFIVEMTY